MKRESGDNRKKVLIFAVAVFAAAWVLRVVYVMHLRASPLADFPVLDELYHVEWARVLAAGNWLGGEVFFRAPLYPYLLGAIFSFFGESLLAARVVQSIYGALTPVAVYFLGRRVFSERVARAAAIVAVLYPFFIYFTNELLIVTLVVLADVLMVIAVLRAEESKGLRRWFVAGVVAGLSAIARPNVLVFLPALFGWMWWRGSAATRDVPASGRSRGDGRGGLLVAPALRASILRFAVVLAGVAAVVLPVTVRNYAVGRDFVPIASQGGINFYIGNNSSSDGASAVLPVLGESWENEDAIRIAESHEGRRLRPSEVSGFWYRQGIDFVGRSPVTAARLYLRKLVLFWDGYELANNKDIYHFGNMSAVFRLIRWLDFRLIAPLSLLGALVLLRKNPRAVLLVLFVLSYMAGLLLFFINSRFRLPVLPYLILFAAAAAFWLFDQARRKKVRALALAVVVLVLSGAFVAFDFYDTHAGDRAQTHMTLGRAQAEVGMHEEALSEYRRAIEISPNYAKAYNSMGLSLERLGRDEEALEAYLEAVEQDSTLASVRNNIGNLYMKRGDLASARRWLESGVALDEYMEQGHMNLAMVLAQQGDFERAEYHLKCAVTADPTFKEAWDALGRVFEETGRLQQAAGAYREALAIDPLYVEARHDLGVVLAMAGRYEESLRELEQAWRLDRTHPGLEFNLARVREIISARGGGGRPRSPGGP